jgi:transcriptional regulator with XRE-family HTH domain
MTPFGEAMRDLRRRKGVSQKDMARAIGVSPAYLSALEHGHKGMPSFDFLQRVAGYFNIIWDEAEALFALARASDPKVELDTSGMPPEYTAFANRLASRIRGLRKEDLEKLDAFLDNLEKNGKNSR